MTSSTIRVFRVMVHDINSSNVLYINFGIIWNARKTGAKAQTEHIKRYQE